MEKFGKKSSDLLKLKSSFFEENDKHLERTEKINDLYITQEKRLFCKNCNQRLGSIDFISHKVPYLICERCTHLNGGHEDSVEFCEKAYASDDGEDYSKNYSSEDSESYKNRTSAIYSPKAKFLTEALREEGVDYQSFEYSDFGAGTGYFVSSLIELGLVAKGFEVSKAQVQKGNHFIGCDAIRHHSLNETVDLILNSKSEVVSMIGVLEHVMNPREILNAIQKNDSINFFYFSLPLFSMSVYLELFFQKGFNRQLGSCHTHLYTKESISYFCNEFGFEIASDWWFGTDLVDLFRHGSVFLEQSSTSSRAQSFFADALKDNIDELQLVLDKSKNSSEVHILVRKKLK